MIVGVGTDIVSIPRLTAALARTPSMRTRVFTPAEADLPPESLAGRFAVKEAVAKALFRPPGIAWQDAEILRGEDGRPGLVVRGYEHLRWHVSIAHDGGLATAVVV
ncbi:MAG TPA: holo-ACP synthase, partial [Solirubrobacteraceae bacterium]|nr:holo-ACP synthase [Solirubrobacteraceae bacterium]